MSKWLPFDNSSDAQDWIDTVDIAKGYPKTGTSTYSLVYEYDGKVCVKTCNHATEYMDAGQISSRMNDTAALAGGYLPESEDL